MTYETLDMSKDAGDATVTLNRPAKRNAMNPTLHVEMTDLLEDLRYDSSINVVVFTGAGPAFCAGMDLKEFFVNLQDNPPRNTTALRAWRVEWRYRTLRYHPKIMIAMINGYCFGGAFSFVEGCDLAIAADEATFGLSEINLRCFRAAASARRSRIFSAHAMRFGMD